MAPCFRHEEKETKCFLPIPTLVPMAPKPLVVGKWLPQRGLPNLEQVRKSLMVLGHFLKTVADLLHRGWRLVMGCLCSALDAM